MTPSIFLFVSSSQAEDVMGKIIEVSNIVAGYQHIVIVTETNKRKYEIDYPQGKFKKNVWVIVRDNGVEVTDVIEKTSRFEALREFGGFSAKSKYPFLEGKQKPSADYPDPLRYDPNVFWYDKSLPTYRYKSDNSIPAAWRMLFSLSQMIDMESKDEFYDVAKGYYRSRVNGKEMCENSIPPPSGTAWKVDVINGAWKNLGVSDKKNNARIECGLKDKVESELYRLSNNDKH